MGYIFAIKVAVFIFPILAFIFTLPYILTQYHKYGSVSLYRSVIIYSFIFYMMCIYFLVILPLPDIKDVGNQRFINLMPFDFVRDFMKESVLKVGYAAQKKEVGLNMPGLAVLLFGLVLFASYMIQPIIIWISGRAFYDKMMKVSFVSTVKRKNTITDNSEANASTADESDSVLSENEHPANFSMDEDA